MQGSGAWWCFEQLSHILGAGVRRMVGSLVESVARTTFNLEVTLTELDGTLMVWLTAKPLGHNSVVQATAMVRASSAARPLCLSRAILLQLLLRPLLCTCPRHGRADPMDD